MPVIEFELQGLPKMTNPSGAKSTHWRVVKAERDGWKEHVKVVVKHHFLSGYSASWPLKTAKLTLTRHSTVRPDPDGLVSGFKAIVDGLVLAGVLENDKFANIGMPDYRWAKTKPKEGKVTVRVEWDLSS